MTNTTDSFMRSINVTGRKNITKYLTAPLPRSRPLITVANHPSVLDDPLIWSVILPPWHHFWPTRLRWSLVADDICFSRLPHSLFFALGQGIPVIRGDGVYQHGVDAALDKMEGGGWVHIFPEGRINPHHEDWRLKWGVGRLLFDASVTPLVIPIAFRGTERLFPEQSKESWMPRYPRYGVADVSVETSYCWLHIRLGDRARPLCDQLISPPPPPSCLLPSQIVLTMCWSYRNLVCPPPPSFQSRSFFSAFYDRPLTLPPTRSF